MWMGRMWPVAAERQLVQRVRWFWWADLLVLLLLGVVTTGLAVVGAHWLAPRQSAVSISLSLSSLPLYTLYSFSRMLLAYLLSLSFAIVYGRLAASGPTLEHILIPILDVLQSIPILSFLPGVVLALVALFPHRNLGAELAAIVLIFTSQSWNLAFSLYQSMVTIPNELREAAEILQLSRWQRFTRLELPFAMVPLLWNSIMSWAGGWFFLMAAEQFTLGERTFLLPGLGAYLSVAANKGNFSALTAGLITLVILIIALDHMVWRPLVAWADRFKVEEVAGTPRESRVGFAWLRRSFILLGLHHALERSFVEPVDRWLDRAFGFPRVASFPKQEQVPARGRWFWFVSILASAVILLALIVQNAAGLALARIPISAWERIVRAAGLSLVRVMLTVSFGALWTVPVGAAIGFNRRLAGMVQPWVQTLASIPATALFPAIVLVLLRLPGGLQVAGILLMALGTHWYILFNVIAGVRAIPNDLSEVVAITRLTGWQRWRLLTLPAVFPYLVTGLITAAGGAWNATIVAEYVTFRGQVYDAGGLGALIARSAETGDYRTLIAATMVMATIVVGLNRALWRRLYRFATERYRLEK